MKPDDFTPIYTLTGPYNIKINDMEMAQNLVAPAAWSLAILQHKPATVIELGTSKGGLSSIISGCVAHYGGEFHTFDIHDDGDYNQYPLHGNSHFHKMDCFSEEGFGFISSKLMLNGKVFLLCDGGNKPKEFNTFAPYLKIGDVIAAHDWCDESIPNYSPIYWGCCEVNSRQLAESCKERFLIKFEPKWFDYSAWFVRQKSK